jgi:hypothetical protein
VFVTDPVAGFPPSGDALIANDDTQLPRQVAPSRSGQLHNLCAIPIFAGIPTAALTCAASAVRRRECRWATYSTGSAVAMVGAFVLFGAAFGGEPRLASRGGGFQRISIASGFSGS